MFLRQDCQRLVNIWFEGFNNVFVYFIGIKIDIMQKGETYNCSLTLFYKFMYDEHTVEGKYFE